jgi:hypothetical protein
MNETKEINRKLEDAKKIQHQNPCRDYNKIVFFS